MDILPPPASPQRPSHILYGLEDRIPFGTSLLVGAQHVSAMVVGTITPPLILAGTLKFSQEGRDDIGHLAPGMAADFIAVDLDRPAFAGAQHEPVAALVLCQCDAVDYNFINGRGVVREGHLTTADLPVLVERTNRVAKMMVAI